VSSGDEEGGAKEDSVPIKRPESKLKSLVNKHSGGPLSKVRGTSYSSLFLLFIWEEAWDIL